MNDQPKAEVMPELEAVTESKSNGSGETKSCSRRSFLRSSAVAAGAATAVVGVTSSGAELGDVDIPTIRISNDLVESLEQEAKPGEFGGRGMSGAEVFARVCKDEELAALFCCPGNYTVINALAAAGIPAYGGRTEGAMCAMALSLIHI